MAKPYFLHNLRPQTYNAQVVKNLEPAGYLVAPSDATRTTRALAQEVRAAGYRFMVDNGNFTLIGQVRNQFATRAASLWLKVTALEAKRGRSARASDITGALRAAYRKLADEVRRAAQHLQGDGKARQQAQMALNPRTLIGAEDITIAAWLSLNIEAAYVGLPRSAYATLNRVVARRAAAQKTQLPATLARGYYPVASALSYNTAFDAGAAFAKEGLDKLSLGFGAFMADDNWTDSIEIGTRRIQFPERFPSRYVRTVAVAKGLWDGYTHIAGRAPRAFHFLGLGAPIMIPLVTLAAWDTPELTFDATSPIKDALQGGTLYVSEPAYLKVRTRAVAFRLASDPTADWDCPCGFCRAFMRKHPFRREVAFKWLKRTHAREVTQDDLRPGGALFAAFPFFAEPGAGSLRKAIDQARIGHNHWTLENITADLRKAKTRRQMQTSVLEIVERYERSAKSGSASRAIRFAYQIISDA